MALTQITTSGLANGAVTSDKISNAVQLGGPTITQIQITDSSYDVLDDTAVSTNGGYIKITGTGFSAGAIVVIGSVNATSTGFVSSTVLNVQVPALTAGTYTVYVVNSNGGTAIGVNGLTYSAEPNWVTSSTLPNGTTGSAVSIQLNATEATTYTLQEGSSLPDGLTLTSGGLLSGTVTVEIETIYSFTVVATDAEAQDSPRAFTITIIAGDPYFYLTTLLLPGNGTNNQNNNVFLDSSNNNLAITRFGNTTQGTFSPFSQTGWSNYFDGNGDYLTAASNAAFNLGAGDYTIEFWVYKQTSSRVMCMAIAGAGLAVAINTSGNIEVCRSLTAIDFTFTAGVQNNVWTHIAVSRSGTNLRAFMNGTLLGTQTSSTSYGQGIFNVGIDADGASTPLLGYMSNMRLVKGTAVYTTNFTPSTTPLTAIANTSLLTCQSNRFIDNSTNNFTITRFGDTSVQAFSPFNPTSAWSAATNGGSGYFDGSGDYLETTNSSGLNGTGNFTIEFWYYPITNTGMLFNSRAGGTGGDGIDISTTLNITTASFVYFSSATINLNSWTHVAIVRNGGNLLRYINGTLQGTSAIAANFDGTTFRIGGNTQGNTGYLTGYISNFRVTNNAVYTSNFTPPTTPLTNIANTSLLLNFTNAGITDATSKNILETVGDAKISTVQSKFGGSSMFFDGSGDWLIVPQSPNINMGAGDFTFECWFYLTNTIVDFRMLASAISASESYSFIGLRGGGTGGRIEINFSNGSINLDLNNSVSQNTWTHIAVVRYGTTVNCFINGNSIGTGTSSGQFNIGLGGMYIGRYGGGTAHGWPGYLDDLRITKGYARYTTNFTPPTSAFPTL
jgi:hypothetical protein